MNFRFGENYLSILLKPSVIPQFILHLVHPSPFKSKEIYDHTSESDRSLLVQNEEQISVILQYSYSSVQKKYLIAQYKYLMLE